MTFPALISLSCLANLASPLNLKLGALYLGLPFPLACCIRFLPIFISLLSHIKPNCVAISMAGFLSENLTYAFFSPFSDLNALTYSTLTLNISSIAFFICALLAFLLTTKTSLLSDSISLIGFSVDKGYLITSYWSILHKKVFFA